MRTEGPVVVGVDEGDSSREALRYAHDLARTWKAPLQMLRIWEVDRGVATVNPVAVLPTTHRNIMSVAQERLDQLVDEVRGWDGDVDVTGQVTIGPAHSTLTDATRRARAVVVGSRGRGGFTGLLLGSTSRRTLRDAHGPAIVVPQRKD